MKYFISFLRHPLYGLLPLAIGVFVSLAFLTGRKQGYSHEDAFTYAQAFVLKEFNTGILLSKMDASGNFKGIYVNGTDSGLAANPLIITPTTNCNY